MVNKGKLVTIWWDKRPVPLSLWWDKGPVPLSLSPCTAVRFFHYKSFLPGRKAFAINAGGLSWFSEYLKK